MLHTREAQPADFSSIQQIAHTTWPVTFGHILSPDQIAYMLNMMYSTEALTGQVNNKQHRFIIASENDTDLGYISYELNYKQQPKTKVHKIYILPAAQGKGVGKVLMQQVAAIATNAGNTGLLLNVNRDNNAVQFYEKTGFEIIGKEDIDIGSGYLMEDYIMHKPL
ncbi:GNAT family N-acetyltransferase [Deminuibacter soli]|uniref:GNAT family N-acetyltransferase n=1 Tax=Deminuibacter soli TaxID=2291815 RepID=A0A3E1NI02_9BACT|nr:GNAT family N-acetyltransferase [Deminuibacter soli]RFM27532.1 GNAT family N-acetyltransferase [Deminuibacter soli]